MSYGGNTSKYRIPYPILGDTLDPQEEARREEIVENQLYGGILAHSGGAGVIREGSYAVTSSGSGFYAQSVENKTQNLPTLEAFINQEYIYTYSPLLWDNLEEGTNYLYARLIETQSLSSLQNGDVIAYSSISSTPPDDGILVATVTIFGTSAVLDSNPSGKTNIPTVADHIADDTDPHGSTLYQTNMVCSGLTVMQNMVVRGTLLPQGGITLAGTLTATTATLTTVTTSTLAATTATMATVSIASGLTVTGVTTLHNNMIVSSGVAIDGRDISADGTTLDAHIANLSNPHATTAAQIGALALAGGTLTGNVVMTSGMSIDGVDLTILQPLYAGTTSNANALHTHSVTSGYNLPVRYIGYSPYYGDTIVSGNSSGSMTYTLDGTNNTYQWIANGDTPTNRTLALRAVVPEDFTAWSQMTLNNKVTAAPARVDVTMLDTAGAAVTLISGANLQNTVWTNSTITTTGGTWTKGSFFTLKVDMTGAIGQKVYVGDLVFKYIPY